MMTVFAASFGVFTLALLGLGLGRLAGRAGIRGSCGGLNQSGGCGTCGRGKDDLPADCPRRKAS